jgi:flap endonuclease-1
MGNADLRQLAEIREIELGHLEGTTVAVDAYNWLYKYLTTVGKFTKDEAYTTDDGRELPTLIGVPRGLVRFFEHDITPVFVFDGDPHERKADELAERRDAKEKAAAKAEQAREDGDTIAAARYEARTRTLDDDVVETTKDLLDLFDVPYCTAGGAGEAQAAHFAQTGLVDYVVSDDYDALLFGAPGTVRNFTSSSKPLELLDFDATCETHDLTLEQLVDVALLCGTDYNDGIHGVGVKTALKGIGEHGDLDSFLASRDTELPEADALREIFLNPTVSDDRPPVWVPMPDVDAVRAYIANVGIDVSQVATSLEKIDEATAQTGLDNWS